MDDLSLFLLSRFFQLQLLKEADVGVGDLDINYCSGIKWWTVFFFAET